MLEGNGIAVAVVHGVIELGKLDQNIHRIESVAEKARAEGVDILLVPSMINGVPIFSTREILRIRKVTETIPGRTSELIAEIANRYNMYIVVGPILERRGSKVYRSAFVVEPSMNIKSVVHQLLAPPNFGQSTMLPMITVNGINIGLFIADDIHMPELSLLMKLVGVDLAVFYPYPQISMDKIIAVARTRALEIRSMVVGVGCTVWKKSEEVFLLPTIVVDDDGTVVQEITDKSMKMVKIAVERDRQRKGAITSAQKKLLKTIAKTLIRYLRFSS